MIFNAPIEVVYGLTVIFFALTVFFMTGKGSSLIVGHNTVKKERYNTKKLSKAIGICFAVITILLAATCVLWNYLPDWYVYFFGTTIAADILAVIIICHLNIICHRPLT